MMEVSELKFSVRDTGIGITDEQKKKLFSEFSKIETTQTDILNPKGVGLGLVISNTLAKSLAPKHMSAGLEIQSGKSGKGSEFFFHILDFQSGNTTFNANSSIGQSDMNNIQIKTNKITQQQPKLNNNNNANFQNNVSFQNSGNSSYLPSQTSPKNVQMKGQPYQIYQTNTQLINQLIPYTKEANNYDNQYVAIDQDQLILDQENNKQNKQKSSSSSTPSSNSSSSPSSRRHSISIPIEGEEDVKNINIHSIAPKFRKKKIDDCILEQQQLQLQQAQQQGLQIRYLSSSAVGSEFKNNDNSGTNCLNSNNNNNNYSFIQNSLSREPNKLQIANPMQQQQIMQQVNSSYFYFEENGQPATPSLPFNSVQSLKLGFQSLQHNSQASSQMQQDLNVQNKNSKLKNKCNCNNILIVDDQTISCNSLAQFIHSITKQQCDKANNSQACQKLISNKYSNNTCCQTYILIFLDLNMEPFKDGFETLIEISDFHQSKKIPMPKVVAYTGESDEDKKQQCIQAGFNDILEKPIQPDQLQFILQTYYLSNNIPQQYHFQNSMSQLSFNQSFQPINM